MTTAARPDREVSEVDIVSKAASAIFALEADGELTAHQIAERVGEPVSSTYRLLAQLTLLGWVERGSRRGLFRLGVMFLRIGGVVEDRIDIRQAALPCLDAVVRQTGASSFLCVRRGDRAVQIERREGLDVRSLAMRMGDSLPLHSGAAAMAILSFLPQGERESYLDRLGAENGRFLARAIAAEIELVRERGYSCSDGEVTPGIAAIGAPIYNHRGELEASLAVSGLRHRILDDVNDTSTIIGQAAQGVSAALGYEA